MSVAQEMLCLCFSLVGILNSILSVRTESDIDLTQVLFWMIFIWRSMDDTQLLNEI